MPRPICSIAGRGATCTVATLTIASRFFVLAALSTGTRETKIVHPADSMDLCKAEDWDSPHPLYIRPTFDNGGEAVRSLAALTARGRMTPTIERAAMSLNRIERHRPRITRQDRRSSANLRLRRRRLQWNPAPFQAIRGRRYCRHHGHRCLDDGWHRRFAADHDRPNAGRVCFASAALASDWHCAS